MPIVEDTDPAESARGGADSSRPRLRIVDASTREHPDTVAVAAVVVGDRVRRDQGDIDELAASMAEFGLLQPICVDIDNKLTFGARRLLAAEQLHWPDIDCVRMSSRSDAVTALKAERAENSCRKAMTPSEEVELGRRIAALETPKAKQRQRDAGRRHGRGQDSLLSADNKLSTRQNGPSPTTDAVVADALGLSTSTYQRSRSVVNAAEDDTVAEPVRAIARQARADMDSGAITITTAARKVRAAKQDHAPTGNAPTGTAAHDLGSAPKPRARPRTPLPEPFIRATYQLTKVAERIAGLVDDDRFRRGFNEIVVSDRSDLRRARERLDDVLRRLETEGSQ